MHKKFAKGKDQIINYEQVFVGVCKLYYVTYIEFIWLQMALTFNLCQFVIKYNSSF